MTNDHDTPDVGGAADMRIAARFSWQQSYDTQEYPFEEFWRDIQHDRTALADAIAVLAAYMHQQKDVLRGEPPAAPPGARVVLAPDVEQVWTSDDGLVIQIRAKRQPAADEDTAARGDPEELGA
jgi:hypothetical protein